MRRPALAPLAMSIVLGIALVACGDDDDAATTATSEPSGDTVDSSIPEMSLVPATTVPVPDVSIPESIPTELVVTELTPGSGPPAAVGDTVYVNYVGVRSEDGTEFDNNYGGAPFPVTLGAGSVIDGWDQGLVGATAGSQVQLDIPTDLAYGDTPQDTTVIQPGDALTFVIDVLAVVPPSDPADAPTAEDIPQSSEPITEVGVVDLIVGDGATLEAGQTGLLNLLAARGDDGEILQSTWETGPPEALPLVEGLIPGLVEGLNGMQVGGRRVITIPSDPALGLTPETNLVIIAELLAVI